MIEETIGRFGFHCVGDNEQPRPAGANVRLYVKSSALSRAADLAISPRLTCEEDIDRFVDEAIAALEAIRVDAKDALGMTLRH